MNKLAQTMAGCAGACLVLFGATAMAAKLSQADQRYHDERAACLSGASNQDRATCLREAGAALQEAKRGGLAGEERDLARNRTARCAALPQADREDCTLRMEQGTTSGSARQGGILREVERPVPAGSDDQRPKR